VFNVALHDGRCTASGDGLTHLMTRTADDGGKDGARRVISGEPGLAHAGAVVADQSGNLVVAHFHSTCCSLSQTPQRNDPITTTSTGHCTALSHRRSGLYTSAPAAVFPASGVLFSTPWQQQHGSTAADQEQTRAHLCKLCAEGRQ